MKLFKCAGWGNLRYHKDRNPSWIALQVSLLDDWDHEQLSDADRWHLAAIWLLAAKHDRPKDAGFEDGPELKYDPDWVRRRCNLHETPNLDKLVSLGYIVMYESVQDRTPSVQICPPSSYSSSCTSTATCTSPGDSPAPLLDAGPAVPEEPAVISIILNDGSYHGVTQSEFMRLQELYPAVDTMAELRKIAGWNEAHPKKRKTRRGIKAHIASWFATQQDRGGGGRGGEKRSASPAEEREQRSIAALKMSLEGD